MDFSGKKDLIKKVQAFYGLATDGIDGPNTWKAIVNNLIVKASSKTKEPTKTLKGDLSQKMTALAKNEIGVEEVNGTNCGPRVNEYKSATWLDSTKPWPWCAAFICWLFKESMKGGSYTFERPQTAGAWDFENWAKKQNSSIVLKKPHRSDIQAGDIVIFTFSHIGIATSSPDTNGIVSTIEGNTDGSGSREGGAVLAKKRKISQIRSVIRVLV